MGDWFMKKPCKNCPFRRDVKPFLRYERAEELANATSNPYNVLHCHETTESDEIYGGEGTDMVAVETTKECAGLLSMQVNENGNEIEGFEPSDLVYSDSWEMLGAYEEAI